MVESTANVTADRSPDCEDGETGSTQNSAGN